MKRFEAAGVKLVALSYDEPDALAAFAEQAGITYPLLTDPESVVIREFGILNTLVGEDDHPWFGMPFPGTYVTDASGTITAKFFENNLALRPGVDLLLRATQGIDVSTELIETTAPMPKAVEVTYNLDEAPMAPGTIRELSVNLRVPDGQHLYGHPVPEGMVATAVEIDEHPGLLVLETVTPPTTPHRLTTGETLQIFDGHITLRVRFSHNGSTLRDPGGDQLRLAGRVRFQSCDDETCSLPLSEAFEFSVPLSRIQRTRFGNAKDGEMDSLPYFQNMIDRRS